MGKTGQINKNNVLIKRRHKLDLFTYNMHE